jgi:tetratricopeptide (TPR) repeat protein
LRGGRLVQAIVQFGFAKEHPDTAALAYALSGEALCRGRQFRDADRILTTAGQLDPSYTDTHRWLAALYYDIGAMEHAREQLEIVAEQAPGDPRPKRLLGEIHRDFEKYDLAVDAYRESLRRDPNQPKREELLVDLAECLLKLRRFEEAREVLRECPRSARSLTLEAETFYEAGENGPAKKPLEEALALDSSYLGAMRLKARMALDANGPTLAAQILRRAVELHPKDHLAHYYLVQAYRRLGERQLAEKHLQVSRDLRALFQKFADLNQKAIKSPADAEIRYQLGVLAGQLDKRELARSWLEHALALDPNHAAARQALDNMSRQSSSPPQANGKR